MTASTTETRRLVLLGAGLTATTLVVAGCGSNSSGSTSTTSPAAASSSVAATGSAGTLTVFAAASLHKVFTDLGRKFEAAHPGVKVDFDFAGSSDLAEQIGQGAPADVFAAADIPNMQKVIDANAITEAPQTFAKNILTIVTAPGNPKHITGLPALTQPGLQVVVCAPQVPCGSAAKRVESDAGLDLHPVSEESSVTDVLGKVIAGQADAGLVYVTDAKGAGDKVTAVGFPEAAREVNTYPIAVVAGSKQQTLAHEFEQLVTGADGQAVLAAAGFGAAN